MSELSSIKIIEVTVDTNKRDKKKIATAFLSQVQGIPGHRIAWHRTHIDRIGFLSFDCCASSFLIFYANHIIQSNEYSKIRRKFTLLNGQVYNLSMVLSDH